MLCPSHIVFLATLFKGPKCSIEKQFGKADKANVDHSNSQL